MQPGVYDLRSLLKSYAASQDEQEYPEMREYHARFYDALCKTLGTSVVEIITIPNQITVVTDKVDSRKQILYRHFRSTVRSYLALTTPYSGYLEAGLLHKTIEELGDQGQKIQDIEKILMEHASALTKCHLDSMEAMFTVLYGVIERQVTRDELLSYGFDPQQRPDIDY
ncbi:hypothetical protein FNU79_01080 [Deinococcus detaillensis]|uniref:Uncharacterized protein n=1 Tax=Deinococcus detaillensis TaxID=2592048 RepID=A0A553V5Y2_9DEIO|nr:hypothetical protein [Deinococcus detaillensis]TSA87872.1 hypothetical protein FNU79_01080 [Deinococcus detaillensis]